MTDNFSKTDEIHEKYSSLKYRQVHMYTLNLLHSQIHTNILVANSSNINMVIILPIGIPQKVV